MTIGVWRFPDCHAGDDASYPFARDLQTQLTRTFWPSPHQQALVRVALGSLETVVPEWLGLQHEFVLDELEPGSFDLMAFIYRRLSEVGHDDAVVDRLKGIYRREWVRANLLAEHTKDIARTLAEAGIDALFVEGAPLVDRFYPERGTRSSWFADVLIDEGASSAAIDALTHAGWSIPPANADQAAGRWALLNADRTVCVLRTSVSNDFVSGDRSRPGEPLWLSSRPFDLDGTAVAVPGPLETLLAVCVSGARLKPTPSLQWIVDAVMILRKEEIDFAGLIELAAARGQSLRLRHALHYLAEFPGTRIPPSALEELDALHVGRRERLTYALSTGSVSLGGSMSELVAEHLAASPQGSIPDLVRTFPGYLQQEWGLSHGWELPLAAGSRVVRRIRAPRRSD